MDTGARRWTPNEAVEAVDTQRGGEAVDTHSVRMYEGLDTHSVRGANEAVDTHSVRMYEGLHARRWTPTRCESEALDTHSGHPREALDTHLVRIILHVGARISD